MMPPVPSSRARPRLNDSSADFNIAWIVLPGNGTRSARLEPVVMIRPRADRCRIRREICPILQGSPRLADRLCVKSVAKVAHEKERCRKKTGNGKAGQAVQLFVLLFVV